MWETTEVVYGRISPVKYDKNDDIYQFLDIVCLMMITSYILLTAWNEKKSTLLVISDTISYNCPLTSYLIRSYSKNIKITQGGNFKWYVEVTT